MCGSRDQHPPPPAVHSRVCDNIQLQNVGDHQPHQNQPPTNVPESAQNGHQGQETISAAPSLPGVTGSRGTPSNDMGILEASRALAGCLNGHFKWALVGGGALVALGSRRVTEDIDLVIAPPAHLREAKNALKSDPRFVIEPRTRHTAYISPESQKRIEIEFLSFPGTFKAPFDESTQVTKTDSGLNVLNIPALLESKCRAIVDRTKESKRRTDAFDINFLLEHMARDNLRISLAEVPAATAEFQAWLEDFIPGCTRLFHRVGL